MVQEQIQKITKDTTIGEIVEKYPQAIETLMSYGVHCVGCHVSPFESLEAGFKGHGIDDATIEEAVKKLNEIIESSPSVQESDNQEVTSENAKITVTKKAAEKIKELISQEKKKALRISVVPGGCSGYKYGMELDDNAQSEDITIKENGIQIFIDKKSMQKLNGSGIDYVETIQGSGFKISNPNAAKSCGCGNSFR